MRRSRALGVLAAAAIPARGVTAGTAHQSFAQDPTMPSTEMTAPEAPGMPGAPGVPTTNTNPSVTDGTAPVTPPDVIPDTPNAPGVTTATGIQNGSTGAAGTGAGSDAPTASGGD